LRVADDLYLMVYSPQNHFDRKDCDIRVAIYNGRLADLISRAVTNATATVSARTKICPRISRTHRQI